MATLPPWMMAAQVFCGWCRWMNNLVVLLLRNFPQYFTLIGTEEWGRMVGAIKALCSEAPPGFGQNRAAVESRNSIFMVHVFTRCIFNVIGSK